MLLIGIGMAGIGFSCGMTYACFFPETMEFALKKYPREQETICECLTVLYTCSFSLAEILAPVLSTHFLTWFGFRANADIFAIICFAFCVVYYLELQHK